MQILIPSNSFQLKGEIKKRIKFAEKQGFNVSNIELGDSPTQTSQVVDELSKTVLDTSIINSEPYSTSCNFLVHYSVPQALDIATAANFLAQNPSHIYIGVTSDDIVLDIWHTENENRAIFRPKNKNAESGVSLWQSHYAWLLACLALQFSIDDAVVLANTLVDVSRETWPCDVKEFPSAVLQSKQLGIDYSWFNWPQQLQFQPVDTQKFNLYPIVDSSDWVNTLLELDVQTIQLRIKNFDEKKELEFLQAVLLGKQKFAQVFINDNWKKAISLDAYGVHLGQEDLNEANLREIAQSGLALGVSTHGYYEILKVSSIYPSYIAFGQVFKTHSKNVKSVPLGQDKVKQFCKLVDSINSSLPTEKHSVATSAIGGIDLSNANSVLSCGVDSLAVIGSICNAPDVKDAIHSFTRLFNSRPAKSGGVRRLNVNG